MISPKYPYSALDNFPAWCKVSLIRLRGANQMQTKTLNHNNNEFSIRVAFMNEIEVLIKLAKPYMAIADKAQRVRLNICLDYLRTTHNEIKETLVYDTPTIS